MSTLQTLRQWAGAILAFLVVFITNGHANAAAEISFAIPLCIFLVCASAYSAQKQILALQAQVKELQDPVRSGKSEA